jgi:hypothetical protein
MSDFGPPCPGCTPALISAQIARFPEAYTNCASCLERGALYQAQAKGRRADQVGATATKVEAHG